MNTQRTADPSPIIGQAVIVVTEAPAGRFQIRSFESPEGPSTAAGKWADRIVRLVHDAVTGAVVDGATDVELTRLRRIESAAGEVLASGEARYTYLAEDGEYVGDLVPAKSMVALRAAVEGEVGPVTGASRCEWCNQQPSRGMPQPPVRVHIRLDGATDDDVARLLPTLPGWLAAVQADPLPERFTTDGSRSISVVRRDVAMEQYRAEADAWMDRERSASRAGLDQEADHA